MKDVFGQDLFIGAKCCVTPKNYRGLVKATIVGFTLKQVKVEYMNTWNYQGKLEAYLTYPSSIALSPFQDSTKVF